MENNAFLKGALIGGVLGGVTAFLTSTKAGCDLRKELVDGCNSLKSNGYSFSDLKTKLLSVLDHDGDEDGDDDDDEDEEEGEGHPFLLGGALGAVIAGLAALLLAPQTGEKLRASLGDKYEGIRGKAEDFVSGVNKKGRHIAEEIEDWKDSFSTIVKKLSRAKNKNQWHINEILDYANMGLRLFHQLKNGKKVRKPVKAMKKRATHKATR